MNHLADIERRIRAASREGWVCSLSRRLVAALGEAIEHPLTGAIEHATQGRSRVAERRGRGLRLSRFEVELCINRLMELRARLESQSDEPPVAVPVVPPGRICIAGGRAYSRWEADELREEVKVRPKTIHVPGSLGGMFGDGS